MTRFVEGWAPRANPLFVSSTDFHLQASSPARNKGTDGSDLGCYPYAPGPVDHLVITPQASSTTVEGTIAFTAAAYDQANNPVPGATIGWSASAGGTIDASGQFTAGTTAGTFTDAISATADGVSASATVIVTPGPVATIAVTPESVTIVAGGSTTFSAAVADSCAMSQLRPCETIEMISIRSLMRLPCARPCCPVCCMLLRCCFSPAFAREEFP